MFLLRPFRLFAKALLVDATPRQLALGLALGMLVGLVPKGNLLAMGLMVLLCSLRVNLSIGLLAAFVFSWADLILDPLTHAIGSSLLKNNSLRPLWTQMYDTAVLPWTKNIDTKGFSKGGSLIVTAGGDGGTVTCKVVIDGKDAKTGTASGPFASAACSDF